MKSWKASKKLLFIAQSFVYLNTHFAEHTSGLFTEIAKANILWIIKRSLNKTPIHGKFYLRTHKNFRSVCLIAETKTHTNRRRSYRQIGRSTPEIIFIYNTDSLIMCICCWCCFLFRICLAVVDRACFVFGFNRIVYFFLVQMTIKWKKVVVFQLHTMNVNYHAF